MLMSGKARSGARSSPLRGTPNYLTLFFVLLAVPSHPAQCSTLTKAAEDCGPVGCGDLTLTAQLDTYVVGYSLVEGDATGALSLYDTYAYQKSKNGLNNGCVQVDCNNDCLQGDCRRGGFFCSGSIRKPAVSGKAGFKHPISRPAKNGTQTAPGAKSREDITVAVGLFFAIGPVTISSKTHDLKWEAGWVDLLVPTELHEGYAATVGSWVDEIGQLPKVSANDLGKFKIQLFKHAERY